MQQEIFDISITIKPGMVIYPNNPETIFNVVHGEHTTHTDISFGTHTGTHIDAPSHAIAGAIPVDQIHPSIFFGPARVLDMTHCFDKVSIEDLEPHNIKAGERIILKTTNSHRGFESFYDDYVYLDGDAAEYLAERKIILCAIDYLSIKKRGSSDHRPHTALLANNIPIIEAVNLKDIPEGDYLLSALPLKLKDLDGSPCRAILIKQ